MSLKACTLTSGGHVLQRGRYQRLRADIESVERRPLELTVQFAAGVDPDLLDETVAVERGCCAFLAIDLEGRVLRIASDDPRDLDPFERVLL